MKKNNFACACIICFLLFVGKLAISKPNQSSRVVTDARGKVIELSQKPRRIVSASVASDEILWLILKKAKNVKSLVGVSYLAAQKQFSHISEEVKSIPFKVGKSIETFVNAKPDLLVLASFNRPELVRQLEQLSLPVFVMSDFNGIEDIIRAIRDLSSLIGESESGGLIESEFIQELEELKKSASRSQRIPKVLAMVGQQGVMAKKTLFDSMLKYAGGENACSHLGLTGWPNLGDEALAKLDPDYLVFPEEKGKAEVLLATLASRASTRQWKAVKDCALLRIPSRNLNAASPFILEGIKKIKFQLEDRSVRRACGV